MGAAIVILYSIISVFIPLQDKRETKSCVFIGKSYSGAGLPSYTSSMQRQRIQSASPSRTWSKGNCEKLSFWEAIPVRLDPITRLQDISDRLRHDK